MSSPKVKAPTKNSNSNNRTTAFSCSKSHREHFQDEILAGSVKVELSAFRCFFRRLCATAVTVGGGRGGKIAIGGGLEEAMGATSMFSVFLRGTVGEGEQILVTMSELVIPQDDESEAGRGSEGASCVGTVVLFSEVRASAESGFTRAELRGIMAMGWKSRGRKDFFVTRGFHILREL
jgi:hypothetical protein